MKVSHPPVRKMQTKARYSFEAGAVAEAIPSANRRLSKVLSTGNELMAPQPIRPRNWRREVLGEDDGSLLMGEDAQRRTLNSGDVTMR